MDLIDEMLGVFDYSKQSQERQRVLLSDILETSNDVIMRLDKSSQADTNDETPLDKVIFDKETVQGLAKAVIQADAILAKKRTDCTATLAAEEEFVTKQQKKYEILSGNMRKLLAFNDNLSQLLPGLVYDSTDSDEW